MTMGMPSLPVEVGLSFTRSSAGRIRPMPIDAKEAALFEEVHGFVGGPTLVVYEGEPWWAWLDQDADVLLTRLVRDHRRDRDCTLCDDGACIAEMMTWPFLPHVQDVEVHGGWLS